MPETFVSRRATVPCALWLAPLMAWSAVACAPTAPVAPPPATPAAVPAPATPPPPPAPAAPVSDWNAAPTNGSPGVNAPKLTGNDLLGNSTFDTARYLPWNTSFSAPAHGSAAVKDGQVCVVVDNKGVHSWDAQLRHRQMVIQKGHTYSIAFMAHATKPIQMKAKVGMAGPPYKEYWADTLDLTTHPQSFVGAFTMDAADDPTAEFAFHFGGDLAGASTAPYTVCLDDIHLDDPRFTKPAKSAEEAPIPTVLVNQTGYLPELPKLATVRNPSKSPLKWELHKKNGAVVASGETKPAGHDAASGDDVQIADFSTFKTPGKGYTLWVAGAGSHPFDIGKSIYKKLKYDALAYFYQSRSGIAIKMPFAGGKQWTRPAGHISVPPNKGDKDVPCVETAPCSYKLDVTGGWYDAGDQGKYVVNGGIAAWTLMTEWERALSRGTDGEFKDGKMNIPERRNKVPDLLDEARWEVEFLLKMQVPDGQPLAGMAHHKIHDKDWTALPTRPDQDAQPRLLWPPSTAATLNLAAAAAQAARVFQKFDKAFAAKCLTAAEKAWTAAQAHPAVYASAAASVGGGPYEDGNVSDELYWAAAELFITTKGDAYKAFLEKSPYFKKVPTVQGGDGLPSAFDWQNVGALGTISLALVPNLLSPQESDDCQVAVEAAADAFQALVAGEGYRLPLKPGAKGYPWGSNAVVLNNALVLALAHDFSGEAKYLAAAAEAMNYILGRNPMDKSYVSGYGERPLIHPHHRFWAHQADPAFPSPPPGVLSGGPNSGLQDPYVQSAGLAGCAPQKCYVDNIEAWSANEVAINWNAPLAWVAAFLDETAEVKAKPRAKTKAAAPKKPADAPAPAPAAK